MQKFKLVGHSSRLIVFMISPLLLLPSSQASELPTGFVETLITDQLNDPTRIHFAPDGRLFVLEQSGNIRLIKDGVLSPTPFLTLNVDSRGEHGVLGLAFDPDYEKNRYFYVYYTSTQPEFHNRISRFEARGDEVVLDSEKIIIELEPTKNSMFHSAGDLHFHTDGKLYVGVGDNANRKNAQNLGNPFGKILRFNLDGSIPEDNPLFSTATGIGKAIWAYGFRNPFSFHFQPETGRLYANDVGAESWEEINEIVPGGNYGWPLAEGKSDNPKLINPIYTYSHGPNTSDTQGCAISGGTFYPSHLNESASQFPEKYRGHYFFIDYCNGWLRTLNPDDHSVSGFGKGLAPNPLGIEAGPDGKLYYVSRWNKALYSIAYVAK